MPQPLGHNDWPLSKPVLTSSYLYREWCEVVNRDYSAVNFVVTSQLQNQIPSHHKRVATLPREILQVRCWLTMTNGRAFFLRTPLSVHTTSSTSQYGGWQLDISQCIRPDKSATTMFAMRIVENRVAVGASSVVGYSRPDGRRALSGRRCEPTLGKKYPYIRISTDISWRVFHISTEQVPYTFVWVNRRNNEARMQTLLNRGTLKYGKLAAKYPSWIYGYFLQRRTTSPSLLRTYAWSARRQKNRWKGATFIFPTSPVRYFAPFAHGRALSVSTYVSR